MNTQSQTTIIEYNPMYNLEHELKIRGFSQRLFVLQGARFSRRTIKTYLYYNRKFLIFARKRPDVFKGF